MDEILKNYVLPDTFFPVKRLEKYIHLGSLHHFRKGDVLSFPGVEIERAIYVISGEVSVSLLSDDGRQKYIYTAHANGVLNRLFFRDRHPGLLVAEEDTQVCFFSKDQLAQIFENDRELIFDMMRNSESKVYYFMNQTKEMVFYSPTVRVLRLLRELCLSEGNLSDNVCIIRRSLSQKNISEITGVHPVTVCKVFGLLKKEMVAEKTRTEITVMDFDKLQNMIEEYR